MVAKTASFFLLHKCWAEYRGETSCFACNYL